MLVTRQCDTEHSHWAFSKYDPSPRKPTTPRMSNQYGNTSPEQSNWQEPYQYLPQGEPGIFDQPFGQDNNSPDGSAPLPLLEEGPNTLSVVVKEEPTSPSRSKRPKSQSPCLSTGESGSKTSEECEKANPACSGTDDLYGSSPESKNPGSTKSVILQLEVVEKSVSPKLEDEEDFDDEDGLEGDGEHSPRTAAERTAARRKMKRFRLTHQQTRFLMSEFAKQPHPDAAHRERLSREIPGLSPRQVQVWFQNRRAKIKRLNADDRDRMIKMRAVPDDFDNVQALHSPYGAVHGLGAPMASPMEFGGQSYAEHMIRPLVVDVRRSDGSDQLSSSGLTPGFGSIGFGSPGLNNPDMMSPISPAPNDRYPFSSPVSTPPLSAGPRTSYFTRPPGVETMRPIQPLHLRDQMSRTRSESLQSPLRTSMSWKGDMIGYSSYQGQNTSPSFGDRNPSMYQNGQSSGYEPSSYSHNPTQSPTGHSYPGVQSPQNRSRLRAASASLPLNLDVRNQYRPMGAEMQTPSPSGPSQGPPSSSQYGSASIYTTSYPSAPLTAPVDFSPPRNSNIRPDFQEYSGPQMSAPMAAPSDFSQAFQASQTSRTPMTDSFGSPFSRGPGRPDFGAESHKRKRSLTLPTGSSMAFSGAGDPFSANA